MKCAGCNSNTESVLRYNTDIAVCSSCTRLIESFTTLHHLRNRFQTESVSWAKAPDCVSCGKKTQHDCETCITCTLDVLDSISSMGVELDKHPFAYRLCAPHIRWAAAWEDRVGYSTDFARQGFFVYFPRWSDQERYVRFEDDEPAETGDGVLSENRDSGSLAIESQQKYLDPLDFL